MASTVLRESAFRRAVPTAAAATRSWMEGFPVSLPPAHRRQLHSSARAKSSLDEEQLGLFRAVCTWLEQMDKGVFTPHGQRSELDALCELVRASKISSVGIDTLERIMESSTKARKEFVQNETRRAWMVGAASAGGFFVGCLTRTKMDKVKERAQDGNL